MKFCSFFKSIFQQQQQKKGLLVICLMLKFAQHEKRNLAAIAKTFQVLP